MQTRTLETIQKISKIGKIISKIVEICCLVGSIGCLIGIISLGVGFTDAFKIGGVTIHSIIEKSAEMSVGTMWASMIIGLILCACESILARMAGNYFKHELAVGTPFTYDGAKEMKRLGIYTIVLPLIAIMLCGIAYSAVNAAFSQNVADMHVDDFNSVGLGIAFIVLSIVLKYGTEVCDLKNAKEAEALPEEIQ